MASEELRIEKLIVQCKSNDVDVKVDALAKLQLEFEGGAEIPDVDAILGLFKTCLRTSNQHLSSATLYALPPLLPLLVSRNPVQLSSSGPTSTEASSSPVDTATLRQVFSVLLTSGGIVDRLGDKERTQAKARESLVLVGSYAFRAGPSSTFTSKSGKSPETPLTAFERVLKETGLGSKVWKVREQSILTLVHLRRSMPQFPIRPYLSQFVDCLEDTDAHVRDCARSSVVELFSGPHVTDAARADLKKEMTKKNVRKTIVDGVLSKLLGAGLHSQEGSESGDGGHIKQKEYIPPSVMLQGKRPRIASNGSGLSRATSYSNLREGSSSRPESRGAVASSPPPSTSATEVADVRPAYIASARDLEGEFAAMAKPFEGKETEHNWAARDAAVQRVRGMLKGDVLSRYADTFNACLKEGFMQWSIKALASLRTTVAVNACNLYSELAQILGTGLDPYCDLLLTNLLKMAGFTKKITAQQSQVCVTDIITHTSAPSRTVLTLLWTTLQEKTVQARAFVVNHLKAYIELHGSRSKAAIEGSGSLEVLEKSIKRALSDQNPAVRESSRALFWTFDGVWHEDAMTMMYSLDPTARKQLEKACPNPDLAGTLDIMTPTVSKKTSIAAAIAASRAKAKAIATAPPSLRHQATAASQTPINRRTVSPVTRTPPKSTVLRPSSPLRASSSPGSPPSKLATQMTTSRSLSSAQKPLNHSGGASGISDQRARSPSLSDHQYGTRRRTSSPLAVSPSNNANTLRRALQTALPASPPSSNGQRSPDHLPPITLRVPSGPTPTRQSLLLPTRGNIDDESLLMASTVPIPEGDTDSEDEQSVNLMSFSAAFEKFPPPKALSLSPRSMGSKPTASVSNALSSGSLSDVALGDQGVVEDALRARAEQAESAAERLLELVDENDLQEPIAPVTLINASSSINGNGAARVKTKPAPIPILRSGAPPVTPNARASAVMKQAAMFKDSPANAKRAASLLDILQAQRHETGWWLKRTAVFSRAAPLKFKDDPDLVEELKTHLTALESGEITKDSLQRVALICLENGVANLSSPPPSPGTFPASPSPFVHGTPIASMPTRSDLWDTDRIFHRLFTSLMVYLEPTKAEDHLEYGLIIVWEMLENQGPYLEGREADLFSMLLQVRFCNKVNVLEATSTIRDALTNRIDPVYGLTTFHGCLKSFQAEPCPAVSEAEVKVATTAFGLIALGKFILRLPAEIAEEELPRLKGTLIAALNDRSSLVVRESAAAAIISAQLVLKDETHLFALLDGLADDKKNLLTYLFDKHGARGMDIANGKTGSGIVKFQKEIRRLDTRTSTPLRVGGLTSDAP